MCKTTSPMALRRFFAAARTSLPINLVRLLIGCVWILLFVSIILFIISPRMRKEVSGQGAGEIVMKCDKVKD